MALGLFGIEDQGIAATPQVLCEFKDIRSGLDSPQNRKGNNRSPVKQCADYLREARNKLYGNEPIQPTWGIVTDMNEFRLYWWTNMPVQYQRFVIKPIAKNDTTALIDECEEARFQRFPEVFDREDAGFDCVIGNPPYVKLQHFRKVEPETTDYLTGADNTALPAPYQSTQTGNFDLYLPFIEKGVQLLNSKGRMGYIAPSVWLRNEYGDGLRQMIHAGQHLDRWLDFVSYQVFDEAITYTALQFYQNRAAERLHFANAPKGGANGGSRARRVP